MDAMHFTHLPNTRVTLAEFIGHYCCGMVTLTRVTAKAFGVPYPLVSGWHRKYRANTAMLHGLTVGPITAALIEERFDGVVEAPKPAKPKALVNAPDCCECDALPWEDCEHTEKAATLAMCEILGVDDGWLTQPKINHKKMALGA